MGELWIVLSVSCGLAYLSEKFKNAHDVHLNRAIQIGIILVLIVYLSFFAGLRTHYNDTSTYISLYKTQKAFPAILTEISWKLGDNPGFVLANSVMKTAGFRTQTFLLVYSFIFVSTVVVFLKRYSDNFTLSVFLFVCAHGYLFSFAAIKQCMSIAIGLVAIPYALKHKWIRFTALILLAATFHPYILLFLLIPLLRFKPWSAGTWWMLALTLIAGLTLPNIINAIVNTASLLGDGYNANDFIGEGINIFRVLVACVPAVLSLVYRRYLDDNDVRYNIFTNCCFLYACIMIIGLFGTANYFGRLAYYFVLFPAVIIPSILEKIPTKSGSYLTGLMLACYVMFFFYGNAINESFAQAFSRITIWSYLGL